MFAGFGDFVPGDAVLNADTKDGQYKLILAVIYVLVGKVQRIDSTSSFLPSFMY